MLNLDQMLDQSLEAVEAAPNYVTLENGTYQFTVVDAEAKQQKSSKEGEDDYVTLNHTYQVNKVVNQEGQPIAEGSLTSDRFMFTEKGLPYFKARTIAIAEANGENGAEVGKMKVSELLAGVKGMTFQANVRKTERSDKPGFFNTRIEGICAVQ